jgi:hypothetical protein
MMPDWLDSLDAKTRLRAENLIETLRKLDATDAPMWVYSEIQEDIPQMARFLILRHLWQSLNRWVEDSASYIPRMNTEAEGNTTDYFSGAGLALKRLLSSGGTYEDIGQIARWVAYEAMFEVLNVIDEGHVDDADEDFPGWELIETDSDGVPTGRCVGGLHESFLSLNLSNKRRANS